MTVMTTIVCYRIIGWADHFENAGSRRYADLTWIPTPNRHDGGGFRRVIAHENGEALYGCWRLIVEVASKCPVRGLLASETGPLDADDLAAKTGARAEVFREALKVLAESKIGWLEIVPADQVATLIARGIKLRTKLRKARSKHTPAQSEHRVRRDRVPLHDTTPTNTTRSGTEEPHITESDPACTQRDTSKPDPTNGEPDWFLPISLNGSDRNGRGALSKYRNVFALKVGQALGDGVGGLTRQRRPLVAVARRLESRLDRDECLTQCVAIAVEKAGAGLDNPAAAWQKSVDELYPESA